MNFKAPFLSYEEVGRQAVQFLETYHPELKLPIPIEGIIELDLGVEIIPVPWLFKSLGQSGFLSFDRTKIFIDEYQYDNFIEKYRFTLAHEIGHFVLHESLYEELSFDSQQEYIEFIETRPQKELNWFESQADWFAGHLLVPSVQLEKFCVELLEVNHVNFSDTGIIQPEFWSYASNDLADIFQVNPIVVEIRIRREGIADKLGGFYLE